MKIENLDGWLLHGMRMRILNLCIGDSHMRLSCLIEGEENGGGYDQMPLRESANLHRLRSF